MKARLLGLLVLLALAWAAWRWWPPGGPALAANDLRRSLALYEAQRWPAGLPEPWAAELEQRLAAAPEVSLLEPRAEEAARELLLSVSWIDPDSVRTELDLPHGIRVAYKARVPALRLLRRGEPVAFAAADGTILSLGPERFESGPPPDLALDAPAPLLPGRRSADAVVQEALEVLPEFFDLRRSTGLDLVRIERSPTSLPGAGVPPSLMFVTREGQEIVWGRAEGSGDPLAIPLERKLKRLQGMLDKYPGLKGVRRLHLDRPLLYADGDLRQPLAWPAEPK